jgi:hypothetical protein
MESDEIHCVYCGSAPAVTQDHVPPKSFFPKPRPSDLIAVPACVSCNRDAGKDEEFFLATFMFSEAGISPAGVSLWDEKLYRMYGKNVGLRRRIASSLRHVDLINPRGLFVGRRLAIRQDEARFGRVVSKIVRGLYYFEYQEPLPASTELLCQFLQTPSEVSEVEGFASQLLFGSRQWPGIFEYRFNRVAEYPEGSIWLIRFWGKVVFWAVSGDSNAPSGQ